ncbi:hypothetical protein OAO58_01520 [bacterium]|nr:hypothetical protein [bacterium]
MRPFAQGREKGEAIGAKAGVGQDADESAGRIVFEALLDVPLSAKESAVARATQQASGIIKNVVHSTAFNQNRARPFPEN